MYSNALSYQPIDVKHKYAHLLLMLTWRNVKDLFEELRGRVCDDGVRGDEVQQQHDLHRHLLPAPGHGQHDVVTHLPRHTASHVTRDTWRVTWHPPGYPSQSSSQPPSGSRSETELRWANVRGDGSVMMCHTHCRWRWWQRWGTCSSPSCPPGWWGTWRRRRTQTLSSRKLGRKRKSLF